MQIYKIRRSFIRFRCRTCKTKININRSLPPETIFSSISSFSSHVHPYFVFLAIYLYFKRNLSFRAIADALPTRISHVSIYKWVIKFGSLLLTFCSASSLSAVVSRNSVTYPNTPMAGYIIILFIFKQS